MLISLGSQGRQHNDEAIPLLYFVTDLENKGYWKSNGKNEVKIIIYLL